MSSFSKEDFSKEIIKQEKIFSIQLNFDTLVRKGIVERKKGTKYYYAILKPNEFPMEAVNQSKSMVQEKGKVYFRFPTEKQRLKTLDDYKKIRRKFS